jgi:hypothetical protein
MKKMKKTAVLLRAIASGFYILRPNTYVAMKITIRATYWRVMFVYVEFVARELVFLRFSLITYYDF